MNGEHDFKFFCCYMYSKIVAVLTIGRNGELIYVVLSLSFKVDASVVGNPRKQSFASMFCF